MLILVAVGSFRGWRQSLGSVVVGAVVFGVGDEEGDRCGGGREVSAGSPGWGRGELLTRAVLSGAFVELNEVDVRVNVVWLRL